MSKLYVVAGRNCDGYVFLAEVIRVDNRFEPAIDGVTGMCKHIPLYNVQGGVVRAINSYRDYIRDRIKELYVDGGEVLHCAYSTSGDMDTAVLSEYAAQAIKGLGFSRLY